VKIPLSLFIILLRFAAMAQTGTDSIQPAKHVGLKYDYKNCKVSIKAGEWQPWRGINRLPLTITLHNNSPDTLKYGLWSTGWLNYYIDDKQLSIQGAGGEILGNIFQVFTVAPYNTASLNGYIVDTIPGHVFHGKFRLFFHLRLCRGDEIGEDVIFNKDGTFSRLPAYDVKNAAIGCAQIL
jgi:hypothetical protein